MDLRQLKRGFEFQRRQNRWQTFRQHGLARAWRTNQENVVAAGSGDFQRALGGLLAAYFAKINGVTLIVNQYLRKVDPDRLWRTCRSNRRD